MYTVDLLERRLTAALHTELALLLIVHQCIAVVALQLIVGVQ